MHDVLEMHILQKHDPYHEEKSACKGMELAEAYVRVQPLDCIYSPEEGLRMGTVFPNLSKPYKGWCKHPAC